MKKKMECCTGGTKLIYSCSGGSDVGQIADLAARKLSKDGCGKMTCLGAIGAHLSGFVESAKGADMNLTIDGCPVACAKKNLEHIGVKPKSYILTEMGFVKGKSSVTDENVKKIMKEIKSKLQISDNKKDENNSGSCCCG